MLDWIYTILVPVIIRVTIVLENPLVPMLDWIYTILELVTYDRENPYISSHCMTEFILLLELPWRLRESLLYSYQGLKGNILLVTIVLFPEYIISYLWYPLYSLLSYLCIDLIFTYYLVPVIIRITIVDLIYLPLENQLYVETYILTFSYPCID